MADTENPQEHQKPYRSDKALRYYLSQKKRKKRRQEAEE